MICSNWFQEQFEKFQKDPKFVEGSMNLIFVESVLEQLSTLNMTKKSFRNKMNWSKRKAKRFWEGSLKLSFRDVSAMAILFEKRAVVEFKNY